jgi:hypothetical protein
LWFEAPLQYVTLPRDFQHMVLFTDPAPGRNAAYGQETNCRLLMQRSTRHLVGYAPATADGAALGIQGGGGSYGMKFLTSAVQAVSALPTQHDPVAEGIPAPPVQLTGSVVCDLMNVVDHTYGPMVAAAWMSRFAPGHHRAPRLWHHRPLRRRKPADRGVAPAGMSLRQA